MPGGIPTRAAGGISRPCWRAWQQAFDSLRDQRPPRRTRKPLSMGARTWCSCAAVVVR